MGELVSILIPNYNKAPYLRETLNSVLYQTYQNWECIVVDDHSTDNSRVILDEFAAIDSRFRIFERPDELSRGSNPCRNYAFEMSNGNFIVYLDSDDILMVNCLQKRLIIVESFPNMDFWVFNVELFKENPGDLSLLWNIDSHLSDKERFLKTDGVWQTSGPLYSRKFIVEIGGFNEKLKIWQDYDLHFRSVLHSSNYRKFLNLHPDVFIRVLRDSLSNRSSYFGKKKNLIQRVSIYFHLINHYFLSKKTINQNMLFSTIFILTSSFFVKYGNWKRFYKYWNLALNKNYISYNQYVTGFYLCLILRASNRFSFILKLIPKNSVFPDINIIKENKMGKVKIHELEPS